MGQAESSVAAHTPPSPVPPSLPPSPSPPPASLVRLHSSPDQPQQQAPTPDLLLLPPPVTRPRNIQEAPVVVTSADSLQQQQQQPQHNEHQPEQGRDISPLLLAVPGTSANSEDTRRSIASRRSSNASTDSANSREKGPPPPALKLNTIGCRPPIFLPPSPMSAGTKVGDTIPSVGKLLVPANTPAWLRVVVDKGPDITGFLIDAYREIEAIESARLLQGGRNPGHPFSYSVSQLPEHRQKNRYTDIVPYDGSRVRLQTRNLQQQTDYINASHFHGLDGTRPYIVCQGPTPDTLPDFWQMLWEQKTSVVVMLTNEEERGRIKCHRYVPRGAGETVSHDTNFGRLNVTLVEEDTMPNGEVILRRMLVEREHGDRDMRIDAPRTIWQLHFTAWPDHRASSPQSVLAVADLARHLLAASAKDRPDAGPMVVHCSAGCGRTGTFCTIDGVLQLLEAQSAVNNDTHDADRDLVRLTVDRLREQRVSAVQTVEQYAFCYEAVLYRLLEWQHGLGDARPAWIQLAPTAGPGSSGPDSAAP
ncbi:hypothetical protein HDU87_004931 [Geranomyces variabilis]|uniref:Uncharacterized protein n=1 Tax=Geranomyces variabilis TaxID=109894 RepID=A0AAD5THG1_9FUNG|nr:hypothetical protein HDU87_004931 [Geranomyces variabilis]